MGEVFREVPPAGTSSLCDGRKAAAMVTVNEEVSTERSNDIMHKDFVLQLLLFEPSDIAFR